MWAIRGLHPAAAALAGAGWGLAVCLLPAALGLPPVASPPLLIVLPLLTGAYAALGALACRAIRFVTPILAFGWILVEVPLSRLHLPGGLLIGLETGDSLLGWVARFFGYALAALVVVGVNASLLSLLYGIRGLPLAAKLPITTPLAATWVCHIRDEILNQRWPLRLAYPRGPPVSSHPGSYMGT